MEHISQSPLDPAFVQDPYPFYAHARSLGPLVFWTDYNLPVTTTHAATNAILRDRRFGREPVEALPVPAHLKPFFDVEAHSMLELEPPRHTRLRSLVLRAFTSRRIAELAPEITQLTHDLIDRLPSGEHDLLDTFCRPLPVTIIARLLGVPEDMAPDLLSWSNAMVMMYQAGRTSADEALAIIATEEFTSFLRDYIDRRREAAGDDLISHLIAAEKDGEKLSTDELISTCVLLLNAGHEATVHAMGNGMKLCLTDDHRPVDAAPFMEELMRIDPPLHMFTRHCYEEVTLHGHTFQRGDQVALLLAAANHDPDVYPDPTTFDPARFEPSRKMPAQLAFGAGLHFCVGAPLARLELQIALPILFARCPNLALNAPPNYADIYHFHGLRSLMVRS